MGSHPISRQYTASPSATMNFLLISLCFLAVAAGLPFPKEFLSPPPQVPPTIYQHEIPVSENHRGFRVQEIVPEGNMVTKVVIQVPSEPNQRIHERFQTNQIVQQYYPENQQPQVIQYQEVPQRIPYVPQGVPEGVPQLFLPAQQVAQAVEQVPQAIHHTVQKVEQVPVRSQQPTQINSFAQQGVQASQEVRQSATPIPEGVQNAQQTPSIDGQQAINERQPFGVQPVVHSVTGHQVSKESGITRESQETYHKNTPSAPQPIQSVLQSIPSVPQTIQSVPQSIQSVPQSIQSVPQSIQSAAQSTQSVPQSIQPVPQSILSAAQPVQNTPQDQSAQQGSHRTFQQIQSWQQSQNAPISREQKVENTPHDTYKSQRTPEVHQSDQQQNRPEPVVTVQHGPTGVHVIRQSEQTVQQQQFVQQNLVQGANEQSENIRRNENTVPVTTASQSIQQQTSNAKREQVVRPLVHVVQHGLTGAQIIRKDEHDKHVEPQGTNIQPTQSTHKASNVFTDQEVPQMPNKQIIQAGPNSANYQPVVMVQHGPSGIQIIRQEEFIAQQQVQQENIAQQLQVKQEHIAQQQQIQQDLQQNVNSPQTSQNEINSVPTAQTISQEVQNIFNKAASTTQDITQSVFNSNAQKPQPEVPRIPQGQISYETSTANIVAQHAAPNHQTAPAQVQQSVQASKPSHQVSHFSFGFQDHSSVVKQENPKTETVQVSHLSFGTQGHTSEVKQDTQHIEATPQSIQNQDSQTKPQGPGAKPDNVQHFPPSLHKVVQNVAAEVPQVSQSIKEATHGVQSIPATVHQGLQQFNQGVQQAFESAQQVTPISDGVRNVYQGIRNSVHPSVLSSAEAYVNSIQHDKQPIQSQDLQEVLNQIQQVRLELQHKKESQKQQEVSSQQEGSLDQENRQIPFQEDDIPQQNQKQFQSGFQPFQNQGQRGQPARPQYANRKPVQSAPMNQIYDNTPHRVESPADDEVEATPIPIIRYENSVSPDGTYQWSYEAGNGIKAQESGLLRNRGVPDKESIAVQGGYSYTGPDGIFYSVEYIADENGFQPLGRHLPTQPPIPEALQKAIDDHMAILATAEPETEEQPAEEPIQTDNKLRG